MGNGGSLGHKNRLLKPVGSGRKHAFVGKYDRDCTTVITFVRGDGEIHFTVVLKKGYKPEEGNIVTHINRYVSTVTAAGTFISGHKGSDLLVKVLQAKLPLLDANSPECFIGDEAGSHADPLVKATVEATNRIYLMGGGGHTGAAQVADSTLVHLKLRRYLLRMSKNLKFIAFRKAELNGTLSTFKPPSITAKDLIPWLEIFASSSESQISVCLAFKRRCWLQGTPDARRDEIKQMIARYSLKLAENPTAALPQTLTLESPTIMSGALTNIRKKQLYVSFAVVSDRVKQHYKSIVALWKLNCRYYLVFLALLDRFVQNSHVTRIGNV